MTAQAKQDIFARVTEPILTHGLVKLGAKKVDRAIESVAKKHGLTVDAVMDEYERQFSKIINGEVDEYDKRFMEQVVR